VIDAAILVAAKPLGRDELAAYNIDPEEFAGFADAVAERIVAGLMDEQLEEAPLLDVVRSAFAVGFTAGVTAGRLEMGGGA
jgi:hypothetical protein